MAKGQTETPLEWLGVEYRILLGAGDTGGAISVVDSTAPPGSGPPRHVHEDADETFVMLEGEAEFWLEGELFSRSAGGSVFVPRGKEHTFRVTGTRPGRHLVILTPGGFEAFFAEMAAGGYRIPEDMEQIAGIAAQHHLRFTGPPLGAGN
ncbi:cupin domain-containing protein [Roseobacteraceae bacterium NS-SX3]